MTEERRAPAVFDTNVVVAAMLFRKSRLAWLCGHWERGEVSPLASSATVAELRRVLGYPKFRLHEADRLEAVAHYVSWCKTVDVTEICPVVCRDAKDQALLDLAQSGKADLLVTGDEDLLVLAGQTEFLIESPEAYRSRIEGEEKK